jgi:hypothetical protein
VFDHYPSDKWEGAQKIYKKIGAEHENSLRLWTKSGTHCDYDELDLINPSPTENTAPLMLYLHKHMQARPSLLSSCASLLPHGLTSQSGNRGRPTKPSVAVMKSGGRCGPKGKKGSVLSHA